MWQVIAARWSSVAVSLVLLVLPALVGNPSAARTSETVVGAGPVRYQSFDSLRLRMPFPAGEGRIIHGYGPDGPGEGAHNAGGNVYSLDFCQEKQGQECWQGAVGDLVVAPTDLTYEYSIVAGQGPLDYHFFEVASEGAAKLCMALAHFELSVPGGLTEGQQVSQGTVLGTLVDFQFERGARSVPHIHMALWTVPDSMLCAGPYEAREPIAFDQEPYLIDGEAFGTGDDHVGRVVRSTNLVGDLDGDGVLTILDYNALLDCYEASPSGTCAAADLNGDGVIDMVDHQLMEKAFES